MAAADQLIALVTKTADKLNALNTAIGTKANIGVSNDAGNNLSVGSDSRPYFNASNIPIGVSSDADNALELGTDNKPYLDTDFFVPSTRILSAGTGINVIGDLSQNRSITLDFDYLDGRYGEGFKQREAVVAATSSNVTLSGLQTIDGVSLAAGDRVLVRQQSNAAQNGVYVAASTAWTRATDFDEPDIEEVTQGASVYVEDGTLLKGTGWTLQTPPPYVIGTTELHFIQYAGAGSYTSGNLITVAGNQINHDTGSWSNKSNLSGATVISNISVDAYGHPTNWTTRNLTAGNIGAEPSFTKNTAFNKNFGTTSGTVAQGNDSRINNGQTAYSWGNHASAGYITGSYTGFDSRYVNTTGDETVGGIKTFTGGKLSIASGIPILELSRNSAASNEKHVYLLNNGTSLQYRFYSDDYSSHSIPFEIKRSGINASEINLNSPIVNTGNTVSLIGTNTGSSNLSILVFKGSGGNTQGYIGRVSQPYMRINNSISSQQIVLLDAGGSDGLRFFDGSNQRTVYHSGNLRSDSQNDARYLQLTGGTLSGNITASNLSGTNTGDQTWSTLSGKPSTFTPSAHTHPASDITSGTFANARISQSSVTQHDSAINAGRVDGKHIWTGSQASYDAIGTKDSNTIYFIT